MRTKGTSGRLRHVGEKTTTTEYKATLETATQTSEQNTFRNYSRNNFDLYDHTDIGSANTYSQLLSAGNNSQIGLAKSFEVNPGDIVDLEVYAKYEEPTSTSANPSALFAALVNAFTLNASGGTGLEGQQAYNTFNSYFGAGPLITGDEWEDDDAPKAYLNYLLFDENFNLVDFGFDQISVDAKQVGVSPIVPHDYLNLNVKVREKGYLYVYLSNENPTLANVYFDDFKITYRTAIEQSNDYYAFGLSIASTSFQKESAVKNNYLYNGKELQDEVDLAWLDYGARMYLPEIGRWGVIDPLAEKMRRQTPYNYAYNNPVRFVDPDGMEPTVSTGETVDEWAARQYSEFQAELYDGALVNLATNHSSKPKSNSKSPKAKSKEKVSKDAKRQAGDMRNEDITLSKDGNIIKRVKGKGKIFVQLDKKTVGFRDRLVKSGQMSAEAFANGLLSIVDGMEFKGSKFDKTKLHNGKISLALFGPEKITTNDGELYAGKTAHWNLTAEGKYKITYQKISGEFLTVESIRATLGVHEYFGHGDRGLVHPTDNEEIEQLEKEYIDNR